MKKNGLHKREIKNHVFEIHLDTENDVARLWFLCSWNRSFAEFSCVTLLRIVAEIRVFLVCEDYGYHYWPFAMVINAVYFIFGMVFVREKHTMRFWDRRNLCMILSALAVTVTGTCLGVMVKTDLPIGMYIVNGYQIVTAAIYGWVFLWGARNIGKHRQEVYPLVLNGLGLASVLFHMAREFHTLCGDNRQFALNLITGGTAVYLETLVFVILFCAWGRSEPKLKNS